MYAQAETPHTRRGFTIAHVVRQYAPSVGGLEAVVENLARQQMEAGHTVRVVTLNRNFQNASDRLPAQMFLEGIDVRRVPYWGSRRYPIAPGVLRHLRDADVIHVHGVDFFLDYLALLKSVLPCNMVLSTHGGFFHTDFLRNLKKVYFKTITKSSIRAYACVVASSYQDEATFRTIRPKGIMTIENGVDIEKFRACASPEFRQRMLYFGRLSPNKNIGALFAFLRSLRACGGDWRLTIAGMPQGLDLEGLKSAAESESVAAHVDFVRSPSTPELKKIISQNSVFVSASHYEGFGLAAVEALSAGLLPILSDIPAHRATLTSTGEGTLVDFAQPEEAARKTSAAWSEWVARGPEARQQAIASVERYAWSEVAARFEEAYRAVID